MGGVVWKSINTCNHPISIGHMYSLTSHTNLITFLELIVYNSINMTLTDLLVFVDALERCCTIERPRCILELILNESQTIDVHMSGRTIYLSSSAW